MAKYKICLVTVDNEELALKISKKLVEEKLAACVNLIRNVKSVYRWQNKIEETDEIILVIKTKSVLIKDVTVAVKSMHNYTVPEIIFLDISEGFSEYLDWLGANTLFTSNISKDRESEEGKE
ncbi:MAG: divalent-cation tolerance protein CutA [Elusimicrobiales bacterium]|jgi:periplasmic divalent cation tolerance protein|nr:divalent-cation tolerance protein CutA [Elusimicrobiales bacterium]HOJ86055.1 divalent-cation tolerance protein CutA [Elusimicrobiales bacterium]HOL62659.1 divalent-cation tolerance protein CutA [Elusimicrobiales bacterium]HPO95235.1 divalent-cation tolerance protein CutA [Elusimicrobiales bacterium]